MKEARQESAKHKLFTSKMSTDDEDKSQLFQWLLEGNNDELRKVNINAIDLNFYEPVDELAFLDERVTPLVYCASLGKTQSAKLLLANQRIDVDLQTPGNGQTPLIAACSGCNYQMAKVLLDNGAQPNKPNYFNQTPLTMTVFRLLEEYHSYEVGRICMRMLELLAQRGADVNWIVDKTLGYTLLHSLCACCIRMNKAEKQVNYDIIRFLIQNGADIGMRGFDGKRPQDLVTGHCGMTAILDLIIKRKDLQSNKGKENSLILSKKRVHRHLREMFEELTEHSNLSQHMQSHRTSHKSPREAEALLEPIFLSRKLKKK